MSREMARTFIICSILEQVIRSLGYDFSQSPLDPAEEVMVSYEGRRESGSGLLSLTEYSLGWSRGSRPSSASTSP